MIGRYFQPPARSYGHSGGTCSGFRVDPWWIHSVHTSATLLGSMLSCRCGCNSCTYAELACLTPWPSGRRPSGPSSICPMTQRALWARSQAATKFSNILAPCSESFTSGWNCKPKRSPTSFSIPCTGHDSLRAVIR